jgi:hypothetical protein
MEAIMDKAIELAIEGDRTMIKLLLEQHMSKGANDDTKASEKIAIQINAGAAPAVEVVEVKEIIESGDTKDEQSIE